MPVHVLNSTSPLVLTTGKLWSLVRTMELRFCDLQLDWTMMIMNQLGMNYDQIMYIYIYIVL